ncbi:hypothetical protein SHIRM173S_00559 [Streptomyces hirsutus]
MVVAGPGEVGAERVGLRPAGGAGEGPAQVRVPLRRVLLLAEHHVEPVGEILPGAGPGVVGEEGGGVQATGLRRLGLGGPRAVDGTEILEQRFHHVPGRHLTPVETGPHAVGVPVPEHRAPAAGRFQPGQQPVQVVRELPDPDREHLHCHRQLPSRPEHFAP